MEPQELNNFLIKDIHYVLKEETLPKRAWFLVNNAKTNCNLLHNNGIQYSTDLFDLACSGEKIDQIVNKINIDKKFIICLNHELMFNRFRPISISKLEDINDEYILSMKKNGIRNTGSLLNKCKLVKDQINLSKKCSIPVKDLKQILSMADLMRKVCLKTTKARLFMFVGVNSLRKLGIQDPIKFRNKLQKVIQETKIVKAVPAPKEVISDIEWAKLHPAIIEDL